MNDVWQYHLLRTHVTVFGLLNLLTFLCEWCKILRILWEYPWKEEGELGLTFLNKLNLLL